MRKLEENNTSDEILSLQINLGNKYQTVIDDFSIFYEKKINNKYYNQVEYNKLLAKLEVAMVVRIEEIKGKLKMIDLETITKSTTNCKNITHDMDAIDMVLCNPPEILLQNEKAKLNSDLKSIKKVMIQLNLR